MLARRFSLHIISYKALNGRAAAVGPTSVVALADDVVFQSAASG